MSAKGNETNKMMTMNGGGNILKGMEGYWSIKPKKRDGGNRRRTQTAKEKAKAKKGRK